MKTFKSISILFLVFALPSFVIAGGDKKKTETVVIQTSAQCGSCKARIESALREVSGVKSAELNLEDKKVTVTYLPKKVTPEQIRSAISRSGYDADSVAADAAAYEALPACCKKDGGHH
jgi:copper chaperone CopZ